MKTESNRVIDSLLLVGERGQDVQMIDKNRFRKLRNNIEYGNLFASEDTTKISAIKVYVKYSFSSLILFGLLDENQVSDIQEEKLYSSPRVYGWISANGKSIETAIGATDGFHLQNEDVVEMSFNRKTRLFTLKVQSTEQVYSMQVPFEIGRFCWNISQADIELSFSHLREFPRTKPRLSFWSWFRV